MMRIALAIAVLVLAGCVSATDREQQACAKLGITPNDDRFWTCMQHMEAQRQANKAASMQMLQTGGQLLAPPPSVNVYTH
jgi:hypothetical protein